MPTPLFINTFQKGSSENANIGFGTMLGVETYTKKGIVQLAKDSSKVSGNVVTDLPLYIVVVTVNIMYIQGDTGKVYQTTDAGQSWTDISNGASSGVGQGLAYFQGYLFAFRGGRIDYTPAPAIAWTTNWQPYSAAPGIYSTTDIVPTIIFPNDSALYFGNGRKVGKIFFGTAPTFDPATPTTGYYYSNNWGGGSTNNPAPAPSYGGLLPDLYLISSMSFLPTNYIALGTRSILNPLVSDIILWNPTLSTYETPLRLYSQGQFSQNGINQLINRNNVLYAVTGGSGSVFSTNGTSFNLVSDLSLYSNIRTTGGTQAQLPVFLKPRMGAIDVLGNKLLIGISTPLDISYYPSGYGLYPCGIWSVSFTDEGQSIQCEYVLSNHTTVAVNKQFEIGFIKCIGSNQILIGWKDNTTYGIDLISTTEYQNTIGDTAIESEMLEVGTPLTPTVIPSIQINTPRLLTAGQSIKVNYRTGFDQNYTTIQTFTSADNPSYKITKNPIGSTRFLQLQLQMASTSDTTYSPEIRNVIIST